MCFFNEVFVCVLRGRFVCVCCVMQYMRLLTIFRHMRKHWSLERKKLFVVWLKAYIYGLKEECFFERGVCVCVAWKVCVCVV